MTGHADTNDLRVAVNGGVLALTWNRVAALNALTPAMLNAAADAVEGMTDGVRLVVVTGEGRAFSSGAAIDDDIDGNDTLDAANRLVRVLVNADRPVLAAVNGLAAGVAVSVALSADIVIATASAYFLPAFVNIGLIPDGGATELISAAVGRTRATKMMMLGERLPACDAYEAGLITHVANDDEFLAERDRLISHLSNGPTQAYREMKRIIAATTLGRLDQTLAAEASAQRRLFGTADQLEGVLAFQERRAAAFIGR